MQTLRRDLFPTGLGQQYEPADIGEDVFAWLRSNKWIFRRGGSKRDIGYADKLRAALLVHKYHAVPQDDGPEVLKEQVHLTPKGLAHLAAVFGREVSK